MSQNLSKAEKQKLLALMQEKEERKRYNQLYNWKPYGWQEILANATLENNQCLAMAGNRVGKTYTGARITACHLTGRYPDWWKGKRFTRPITAWAAGASTVTTRDILQKELLENSNANGKPTGTTNLNWLNQGETRTTATYQASNHTYT